MATHALQVSDAEYQEVRSHRLLGFLFFLISDSILFCSFIFSYLYDRSASPMWPPAGVERPGLYLAAVNSIVLFGSGVTMHLAMEAWRHANRTRFTQYIIATIVLGIGFLSGQAYEYTHLHDTWWGSVFGASFFTLTGMHGFHVFIGVCFLITVLLQARNGVYDQNRYFGLTAATLYWHFVDVIWVALFFLFYVY
ncbi:MAG: heme-copper oxidase subunit III [Candidatus Eremiobacteraeota bacterium]|nr:heme-copper oxidase subunit III [Candidatus Eremiobacteraeota bacterium]MBV8221874.1 heme-copper oxidase subunit III [Candidatus Eremiobacteraeota bacterium]MBV8282899.1 heme-copper oxidase subunit III [Candidatus Eremiobacteraeota bacterium]